MIYCTGRQSNLQHLTSLFTRYANVAGQWVKPSKLTICCGAMHQARKIRIAKFVGFPMGFMSFMYLGVPVFRGTPKKIYFQALVDKTKCKLAFWKDVLLSNVGKTQIIQYVIHNMMVYSITTYSWPLTLMKEFEIWFKNFVWSRDISKRRLTTID